LEKNQYGAVFLSLKSLRRSPEERRKPGKVKIAHETDPGRKAPKEGFAAVSFTPARF
jgi:hypothetical protein